MLHSGRVNRYNKGAYKYIELEWAYDRNKNAAVGC